MTLNRERNRFWKKKKNIKSLLLDKMQEDHIDTMENAKIKVNYIDGYVRQTVDGKKLQKLYPDAFQECSNTFDIAPYIRVQVAE